MAVFACEHMMREQAAYHWMVTSCNASEGDRSDSHWRQPWTPVSATLVTEMADQKSLHWASNRHISIVGFFLLLVWRNQHHLLSLSAGFIPCHSGITWASSMIFSEPSGSIPCVASLAITWVNLPTVGGQPTQMYQSRQWACNRHSVHGRTKFYRTNWTVAHGELFHRCRGPYWTTVEWKELLPDSSLSHLNYESRSYDIGLCGTSMSGICYIIAEQYWEAWGLFWKRSVSLCFLGVLFGFGFSVVCVVVCCLVFCVCWWHLDYCLTFSLLRGNRQSKQDVLMTVWASSAHGTGKKKYHIVCFCFHARS